MRNDSASNCQSPTLTVQTPSDSSRAIGRTFRLREVQRGLTITRDQAESACDELVASGHLALVERKQNRSRTVTVTYQVVSVDADAGQGQPAEVAKAKVEMPRKRSTPF